MSFHLTFSQHPAQTIASLLAPASKDLWVFGNDDESAHCPSHHLLHWVVLTLTTKRREKMKQLPWPVYNVYSMTNMSSVPSGSAISSGLLNGGDNNNNNSNRNINTCSRFHGSTESR